MKTMQQGALGEALAREFLESHGYRFLEANFRRRVGEIDLIMRTPDTYPHPGSIVFVEVRYRGHPGYGGALGSVDWKKQRKMTRAARAWLQKNASSRDIARLDVIAIGPMDHIQSEQTIIWNDHHVIWVKNAVEGST